MNDLTDDDYDKNREDVELFYAQVETFFFQQCILACLHALEMFIGYHVLPEQFPEAVTCSEDGDAWVFNIGAGKMFLLLHTFGVKQSLSVASTVFFKTVKKHRKIVKRRRRVKKKREE